MKPTCSILIPTFNNPEFLNPCIDSIVATGVLTGLCELVIINNGRQPISEYVKDQPNIRVLEPGKNLGWERGLQYGIENTDSEFLCFQNDDTLIPKATQSFYQQLLWPFQNENIAAVGPSTTIAAGWHSIHMKNPLRIMAEVSYLIFFTVMVRRSHLLEVGGIDVEAPGGDDLDLSIRFRKAGKNIVINPDAFIIHHAFKTGERVRGGRDIPGGWNSPEMTDKTNKWLIQKHGFKTFLQTMRGLNYAPHQAGSDSEGAVVASFVQGEKVVELGCGFRKTVPESIGIDVVPKGEKCMNIFGGESVADIVGDVTQPLPFPDGTVDTIIARHILEHCVDSVKVIGQWVKSLKIGGRLIIAVPNQEKRNTIPLNPEHCHAYTPESLKLLMETVGLKTVALEDPHNGISFVGVFEKVIVPTHILESTNGLVVAHA